MHKYIFHLLLLLIVFESKSQNYYSESIYSEKKEFEFNGVEYKSKVIVIDTLNEIKINLINKKKDTILNFNIKFENLLLENKFSIYNSIILLFGRSGVYYYDLVTQKKIYTKIGNRYNEDLIVGPYNPVVKNGILEIYNYKLDLIDKVVLPNNFKNSIFHEVFTSDVMNGIIKVIALIKYGRINAENTYLIYTYNAKTKKGYIK